MPLRAAGLLPVLLVFLVFLVFLVLVVLLAAPLAVFAGKPLSHGAQADAIVILKSQHRLELWSGQTLLKAYQVALGRGGAGPKQAEGDGRTPLGLYRVLSRAPSKKFRRFLRLDYPNAADRAAFALAQREHRLPPGARIGGDIGIHGEKKGFGWLPHKWFDWTQGCIAVDNDEIDELHRVIKVGARVTIRP